MEVDGDLKTILAEQRLELTAALDMDDDLSYAYQLQLQEAINASLNSNDAAAAVVAVPNDAVVAEPNETVSHLLAEELSKYEQQLLDREKSLAEMKNMQNDLSRRIHDHAFACEIMTVPEDEWQNTGAYLQKPYGEGSSSSLKNVATNDENSTFRVYLKGLVSEEMVEGTRKWISGLGIAICDPNDAVVFEMSKGLMANENDLNVQIAELKALIEGLDVAFMLGLKRVNVYLSDRMIFDYVTRRQPRPEQGNLATLLEQVSLLGRKFTPCHAYFVEQYNDKYVLKLARDAIAAQVRRPVQKGQGKGMVETCAICLEDTYVDRMFSVDGCWHRYCFSCMKKHAESKLLQGVLLPICPHEGCKSELKKESCKRFLSPELFELMSQRLKEASIPAAEKIYCPYPRCSTLMSRTEVCAVVGSSQHGDSGARNCMKCRRTFCINCRVPWHGNMRCHDYKRLYPHLNAEDARLNSLAYRNKWRQCPKCSHMVSLAEGCYHIYCRCGHQFCYTCGAQWVNKKATCICPIWDERNIIRQ